MKKICLSLLLNSVLAGWVCAVEIPMVIDAGGAFDVSYELSTGQSAEATLEITGDLTADVVITNGVVTGFRFVGGNVAYSDATVQVAVPIFFGSAFVRVITKDIVASPKSNAGAGAVNAETGVISNSGHRLVQDRGTVTTRYLVNSLLVQEEVRNLAEQPDDIPLVGVTTVTAELLEDLGYATLYRIRMEHTRDETRTQPVDVVDGTVTIREVGGFTAVGEVWVPGQTFANWGADTRNQVPADLASLCETTGQPLIVLYAFDAAPGSWTVPVDFDPAGATLQVRLPENGLKAPIRLEFSGDLEAGGWQTLEAGGFPSVFGMGESGLRGFGLPAGDKGFARFSLAP